MKRRGLSWWVTMVICAVVAAVLKDLVGSDVLLISVTAFAMANDVMDTLEPK